MLLDVEPPADAWGLNELADEHEGLGIERSLWRIEQRQQDMLDRLRRVEDKMDRSAASKGGMFDPTLVRATIIALAAAILALVGGQALLPKLLGG